MVTKRRKNPEPITDPRIYDFLASSVRAAYLAGCVDGINGTVKPELYEERKFSKRKRPKRKRKSKAC